MHAAGGTVVGMGLKHADGAPREATVPSLAGLYERYSPFGAAVEPEISRMQAHVSSLLAHFRGRVYCWDVVNEALAEKNGEWRADSPWRRPKDAFWKVAQW
jgi:hypothetical protein